MEDAVSKTGHFFCWSVAALNLSLLVGLTIGLLTGDGYHSASAKEPIHPAFAILSVAWLLATFVSTVWPLATADALLTARKTGEGK
jgi:hypothetical protein